MDMNLRFIQGIQSGFFALAIFLLASCSGGDTPIAQNNNTSTNTPNTTDPKDNEDANPNTLPLVARIAPESLEATNAWFNQGATHIAQQEAKRQAGTNNTTARNIIVFVGNGMGISTLTASRIYAGQQLENNQGGEEHSFSFESFPYSALLKTYSSTHQVGDSASTMSAMMTGVKSFQGGLAISPKGTRGRCDAIETHTLTSILDLAKSAGMRTGLVTTAKVTDATLAATYAKTSEAQWQNRTDKPCATVVADIATQLLNYDNQGGIDVVLGGGRGDFLPQTTDNGQRTDNKNLIQEWQVKYPKGTYISNRTQLLADNLNLPLLGLFDYNNLSYNAERPATQPSLTQMVDVTLDKLAANDQGYLLVVESGRIGHAHQQSNAARALDETAAFDEAIKKVLSKINLQNTLVIVTGNRSYPLTIAGYPKRGNDILGLVTDNNDNVKRAADKKPYTTLGYNLSPSTLGTFDEAGARKDLSDADTGDTNFKQQSLIPVDGDLASGEDIVLYATGPGAQWFRGVQEQNIVFHVIQAARQQ